MLVGPTEIVNDMRLCVEKFRNIWNSLDESDNFQQRYSVPMAKEVVRPVVRDQIRQDIDVSLLDLLGNLKQQALQQLDEEKGKKKAKSEKKPKKSKKADKKAKKVKGDKCCDGLKLMKEEDIFSSMVSELVRDKILVKLPRKFKELSDFMGDINLLGSSYTGVDFIPDPSFAQLRSCLTENAILPLGSVYCKNNSPLVSTLLLFGPSGSGKSHLSKAIACHAVSYIILLLFLVSGSNVVRLITTRFRIIKFA